MEEEEEEEKELFDNQKASMTNFLISLKETHTHTGQLN